MPDLRSTTPAPPGVLTAEELAAVRREYRSASLLPGRAYQDPAIFEWERDHVLRTDWVIVGREWDAPEPGSFFGADVAGEPILVAPGPQR